jgi:ribosomal protein S6
LKTYEVVVILDQDKVEADGETFANGIADQIAKLGGTIKRTKDLGKKTFARPIKKKPAGIYWDFVVEAEGPFVAAIKDFYRLNATVLRLVVFDFVIDKNGKYQDDMVFNPTEGHSNLIKEENFQDAYDREERPFRRDDR